MNGWWNERLPAPQQGIVRVQPFIRHLGDIASLFPDRQRGGFFLSRSLVTRTQFSDNSRPISRVRPVCVIDSIGKISRNAPGFMDASKRWPGVEH